MLLTNVGGVRTGISDDGSYAPNVLLDSDGNPIWDSNGNYITTS